MSLDRYRLQAQLGAGPDGVSYRALSEEGETSVEVRDLSRAREFVGRWDWLAPRLRLAAQLDHPSAIRVIELGLIDDSPYAVLEWVGVTTLASAVDATGQKTRDEAIELVSAIAGALGAAHRLGLAHGRLGPGQVLLVDGAKPKLDFTGARVGFPVETATTRELDNACREARTGDSLAALRAADLYSLGALLAWLLTGQTDRSHHESRRAGLENGSPLGDLVRALLAGDPADRPTAYQVQERLAELLAPLDATGIWSNLEVTGAHSTAMVQPGKPQPVVARSRHETFSPESDRPRLGRYQLLDKLGEGGQGVVYRAEDPAEGTVVAIKVLRTDRIDNPQVLSRFRKEARLMAEANNPYVVNLLEFNEDDGIPYMVLEFVAGESLGDLLEKQTRLDEKAAISLMSSVARGLMEAHECGIVHRDIKPSNILFLDKHAAAAGPIAASLAFSDTVQYEPTLERPSEPRATEISPTLVVPLAAEPASRRIKISDFGLARHIVDTESMVLTAAGALLGTPHYMAPEQWTGQTIDPRTDVYAMGATLFQLLAGRPPFEAQTRDALCAQHCNEPPPRLASLNPSVSEGLVRVVERALCKRPEDRYIDAGAMLRDLEALLHGKPTDLAIHPRLPDCDPRRILQFEFRWELESSPRQLWPLVTNTDRLDRAIGFTPVRYQTRYEPGRGVRTFAEGRKAGQVEIGEEHPYEWVEPRRMGVLREYSRGPFLWLVSTVELTPRPGGGTSLVHRLRLEPSSWKIRVGSRWGVGVSLRKSLERVYLRIDATLKGQAQRSLDRAADPFAEPAQLSAPRRQRLERLLDRLVEQGVDASVVERLGDYLVRGSDQEVARIRPLAVAARFGLDADQVVAACLQGAHEGLLNLHWDLLCPVCRISCQVTDTLRAIGEHAHCEACHLDFQLDFANSIELIFRVHPEIRKADLGTYCIGGPAHSPHVFAQIRVAPNERIELELELPEGTYRLRGPQLPWSVDFQVKNSATIWRWEIELGSGASPGPPSALRAGGQVLVLSNGHSGELVVRIERTAARGDALTAARATSLALFRELFPGEHLAPGQLATVSTVTLLVTALEPAQADALYHDLGDARAFGVVHEHFQRLGTLIRQGGGAVVKTMGDGLLASFSDVTAAVKTALELARPFATTEAEATIGPLRLRVGVHRGPTLAATFNDQLDYFGTTARQASAILQYASGSELILTRTVAADPDVAALLSARQIASEVVATNLPGHPHVIRVRLGPVEAT
jgi:serine/threonine protein kinase/class 3 adenylate cyclase